MGSLAVFCPFPFIFSYKMAEFDYISMVTWAKTSTSKAICPCRRHIIDSGQRRCRSQPAAGLELDRRRCRSQLVAGLELVWRRCRSQLVASLELDQRRCRVGLAQGQSRISAGVDTMTERNWEVKRMGYAEKNKKKRRTIRFSAITNQN